MSDIRNFINLMESAVEGDEEMIREFAPDAPEEVDAGLEGTLDPRALAKLLPDVDDLARFVNAVRKVQKGDLATLTMLENRQLAAAFVSLLRDDSQQTMKVFQRLRMVHSTEDGEA